MKDEKAGPRALQGKYTPRTVRAHGAAFEDALTQIGNGTDSDSLRERRQVGAKALTFLAEILGEPAYTQDTSGDAHGIAVELGKLAVALAAGDEEVKAWKGTFTLAGMNATVSGEFNKKARSLLQLGDVQGYFAASSVREVAVFMNPLTITPNLIKKAYELAALGLEAAGL